MESVSRRRFMQVGAGAAGLLAAGIVGGAQAAENVITTGGSAQRGEAVPHRESVDAAYSFLGAMMDGYASGNTLRLIQSYADQQGLLSTAFTYDNALAIIALVLRGRPDDLRRATVLGDTLLYAQRTDERADGRLRQAYFVNTPNADGAYLNLALAPFFFIGSAVGDVGWAAIALTQLAARTRERRFLDGAVALGEWIVANAFDTRGPGGYSFGVDGGNNKVLVKSSEHNIDVYALFTMLAQLTGNSVWTGRAAHARGFIEAMWNAEGGFFWTGSDADGATINRSPIPEDVQSWSYLALLDPAYAAAVDWAKTNLATTDTPQALRSRLTGNLALSGVTFSNRSMQDLNPSSQFDPPPCLSTVWMEGTGQMVAALLARKAKGERDGAVLSDDRDVAEGYLANMRLAQAALGKGQTVGGTAIPDGLGIVAASSVVNTGFGFSYYPNLHVGATSWYLIGAQRGNPYQLKQG